MAEKITISSDYCVEVSELIKSYNRQTILNHVNLQLEFGKIHGVLGRNGAGKTTLFECMIGLRTFDSGTVIILGERVHGQQLSHIGVQPQEANLFPRQTVKETLQLFASFYPEPMSIDYLINILELEPILNKKVKALSVGQRQRLLVAVALIGNPKLIILDEPTSGIDPQIRHLIWDCLLEMKEKNKTILLSTHYMDEAEKICDTVSILHNGKIIVSDTPKNIIVNNRKRMTDNLEDVFIYLTGKEIRKEVD